MRSWLAWTVLFLLVLGIRSTIAVLLFPSMQQDPDAYVALAEGWAATGTFGRIDTVGPVQPTAYRPPLYPWVLSWFVESNQLNRFAVSALHVVLGALTCLLTAAISQQFIRSSGLSFFAWCSAIAVAVDPILIRQSSLVMTETAATFFAVLIWWIWLRWDSPLDSPSSWNRWYGIVFSVFIGLLLGGSCLLRPTSLVWAGLLVILNGSLGRNYQERILHSALIALSVFAVLLPWAIRNQRQLGELIWTTTHGGYTLLLANNPVLYEHFDKENLSRSWDENRFHRLWDKRGVEDPREVEYWSTDTIAKLDNTNLGVGVHKRNELEDDRLANAVAILTIKRNTGTFVKSCLARLGWFFALAPGQDQASRVTSLIIGGWYCLVLSTFAMALVDTIRRYWVAMNRSAIIKNSRRWLPAIALSISLIAVHTVFWSNMRMRAPMMPVIYVVVARLGARICKKM